MTELPRGPFRTIVADPPWPSGKPNGKSKWMAGMVKRDYPTMNLLEIMHLPVNNIIDPKGTVLLLWTTWGNVAKAIAVMNAWGFNYATGMPWLKVCKTKVGGEGGMMDAEHTVLKPIFGPGVWFQHCTELLLVGRRGKPFGSLGNPRPARKGIIISPRLEHSRKPEEVHKWVETAGFPKPYLELFARRQRKGWTVWGNEV